MVELSANSTLSSFLPRISRRIVKNLTVTSSASPPLFSINGLVDFFFHGVSVNVDKNFPYPFNSFGRRLDVSSEFKRDGAEWAGWQEVYLNDTILDLLHALD